MTNQDGSRRLAESVERFWTHQAVPVLTEFLRIPNVSPAFDPQWEAHGHMQRAAELIRRWCEARLQGHGEVVLSEAAGRTPAILLRLPGAASRSVLFYGHLDKQPEVETWAKGLGPWTPVTRGDRLYGRGGVDDGYAVCAVLGALEALREEGESHPDCTLLLECGEESGSPDLEYHLGRFDEAIGSPDLIVALDSEAGDYDRLWTTTSLRGTIIATLHVALLTEGVHSGAAGGIVPSTFRIVRQLLERIESANTGALAEPLQVEIPGQRREEAQKAAAVLGSTIVDKFPWLRGVSPTAADGATLLLRNTWRSSLSVTGSHGLPSLEQASSTQLPSVQLKLAIRIPPTLDAEGGARYLKNELERDPPYGAHVRFEVESASRGWNAPPMSDWLARSVEAASREHFGKPARSMGTGGTIPFVEMLGQRFPRAAFLVTGVAGPGSNAHGPNEFLHLPAVRKLTACLATILADSANQDLV